jgi:DNA modification methylase
MRPKERRDSGQADLLPPPDCQAKALLEDALLDVTSRGDVVLEPFANSGSTVLAARAVGRMCRAIEIDALSGR